MNLNDIRPGEKLGEAADRQRREAILEAIRDAVKTEREACAKVCDDLAVTLREQGCLKGAREVVFAAELIRLRGKPSRETPVREH